LCSLQIDDVTTILNNIKVIYSVNPTGGNSKPLLTKNGKFKQYWEKSYCYWGTFNEIVELPYIFSKMNDDDYTIITSYFKRDHVYMPFIEKIIINNLSEYNLLKIKNDRKNKLSNILKNSDDE
jgi:hypothetical protein